jgi:hypothetical protein
MQRVWRLEFSFVRGDLTWNNLSQVLLLSSPNSPHDRQGRVTWLKGQGQGLKNPLSVWSYEVVSKCGTPRMV